MTAVTPPAIAQTAVADAGKPDRRTINPFPTGGKLPADLVAIPIWADQANAPVKICAIVRKHPDAVQGHLLLRRDLLDARVYLGCLVDALGVLEMLEIWVQSVDGVADAVRGQAVASAAVTNQTLDLRWHRLFDVAAESWPAAVIASGFEKVSPPPTFFDVTSATVVHPGDWRLCTDDGLLAKANLPAYSSTLHRYLVDRSGANPKFVPVSIGSPKNEQTADYETIVPKSGKMIPFNPSGGLVLIRPAGNLRVAEFNDLLGGKLFDGAIYGKTPQRFGPLKSLAAPGGGFLFPADTPSRLVETFLLKVGLLTGMVEEVARYSTQTGRPLLNLQPTSFSIRLDEGSSHLPTLWPAKVMLTDAGDAVPIELPQSDIRHAYSLPGPRINTSIYQPAVVSRGSVRGFGQLFLSSISDHETSRVFEGMLTLVDPIRPTPRDVLRVRVPVAGQRVDLYVKLATDGMPSPGLIRFKSIPDARLKPHQSAVESLVGVPLQEVAFEFYPLLGTAADIYSLAVIGVEILTTAGEPGKHAERVRDLLVLASRCRETQATGASLEDRIAGVFNDKPETIKGLGPQLMVTGSPDSKAALRAVTPELWFALLAQLIRMLPGLGRDSQLADFGDTLGSSPTAIHDNVITELTKLTRRARSLLLGEWGLNRAVGAIVEEFRRPGKVR